MAHLTEEMFVAYIKENQERFYRLAYRYVKNSEDAMDVVQDAILKAYEKYTTLRDADTIKTWFYRILVNTSIDALRRLHPTSGSEVLELLPAKDGEPSVLDTLALSQAIDRLPAPQRTVITLRFFEDMKLTEIAEITGATLSATKNRLYRGLELLRVDLEERT